MCLALGSRAVDKCYAIPLAHGDFSTATARLLRDAYQPLHSVISVAVTSAPASPTQNTTQNNTNTQKKGDKGREV